MRRSADVAPAEVPLSRIAIDLSTLLHELSGFAYEVQDALAQVALEGVDDEAIRKLQRLDQITQMLEDVAQVLSGIAEKAPADLAVRADTVSSAVRGYVRRDEAPPTEPGAIDWL